MFRTVFRFLLALIAAAAVVFGVWYYFSVYQKNAPAHGTLIQRPAWQMTADGSGESEAEEWMRDCFLPKNGDSAI